MQCIASIVLYARRRNRGAATFADEKIFELASTGLLLAMYCVAIAVKLPPFGQPAPTTTLDERSDIEEFVIACRDMVEVLFVVKGIGKIVPGLHHRSFLWNFRRAIQLGVNEMKPGPDGLVLRQNMHM